MRSILKGECPHCLRVFPCRVDGTLDKHWLPIDGGTLCKGSRSPGRLLPVDDQARREASREEFVGAGFNVAAAYSWPVNVVLYMPLLTIVLWLIGKPLLHGHIGWLWWVPSAMFVVAVLAMAVAGTDRRRRITAAVAVGVVLVAAPAAAKLQQLAAERQYALTLQGIFSEGRDLSRREAAELGWDFCYGLDQARGAPAGSFARNDPHGFVAEVSMQEVGADATHAPTAEGILVAVRMADEHLC